MELGIVLVSAACRAQSAANTVITNCWFVFRTVPLFLFKNNTSAHRAHTAVTCYYRPALETEHQLTISSPLKLLSLHVCQLGGGGWQQRMQCLV